MVQFTHRGARYIFSSKELAEKTICEFIYKNCLKTLSNGIKIAMFIELFTKNKYEDCIRLWNYDTPFVGYFISDVVLDQALHIE